MKAIKVEDSRNNRALATVQECGHGNLKSVVAAFLDAYIQEPHLVYHQIVSINAGVELSTSGPIEPRRKPTPVQPGTLPGEFGEMFN